MQSSETVTPDVNGDHASTQWLNLLATDAAQAGNGFSLPSSARSRLSRGSTGHFHDRTSTPTHLYSPHITERQAWQADADIVLSKPEAALFRRFTERIAVSVSWFLSNTCKTNKTLNSLTCSTPISISLTMLPGLPCAMSVS